MINVSVLGASGYGGGELLRLLLFHKKVKVQQVTSRSFAGKRVTVIHPNLRGVTDLHFCTPSELTKCDLLFCALPNGESMHYMDKLMKLSHKIIDTGADFRLKDLHTFESWYGEKHVKSDLLGKFVYGIAELHRTEIKNAKYIACGGCEATVSILSLYPLVKKGLIDLNNIIIDGKMSSSQAGNKPTLSSHHAERSRVVRTYAPLGHRHTAEIEQELSFGNKKAFVSVTATSIEMVRGLLVTIHTKILDGVTEKNIWSAYREIYKNEPFIRIVNETEGIYRYPEPKILEGTNYCDIGFALDSKSKHLVVIGAIDNLGKGTAGQAVQAMNIMCGYPETTGLTFPGLHPV
ncbi:N-acetyl-gamma-glutamyl-phosphate reductase [Candidatus Gottesmanbacteria bacterium]|nr:N-acetyl-gamma-glutamyl-phosphate reductase [Candidatus Gottesmanbacteria bacterium]